MKLKQFFKNLINCNKNFNKVENLEYVRSILISENSSKDIHIKQLQKDIILAAQVVVSKNSQIKKLTNDNLLLVTKIELSKL